MSYLPLAHILEVVVEASLFQVGAAIGYGSPFTLVDNAPALTREGTEGRPPPRGDAVTLRPTIMAGVPRIWNTIKARILGKVEAAGGIMAPLFKAALQHKVAALRRGGNTPILDALLFRRRTAAALGGRLRLIVSGGGPLAGDTQRFMYAVPLERGWPPRAPGTHLFSPLSCPASLSSASRWRRGTGSPRPAVQGRWARSETRWTSAWVLPPPAVTSGSSTGQVRSSRPAPPRPSPTARWTGCFLRRG